MIAIPLTVTILPNDVTNLQKKGAHLCIDWSSKRIILGKDMKVLVQTYEQFTAYEVYHHNYMVFAFNTCEDNIRFFPKKRWTFGSKSYVFVASSISTMVNGEKVLPVDAEQINSLWRASFGTPETVDKPVVCDETETMNNLFAKLDSLIPK